MPTEKREAHTFQGWEHVTMLIAFALVLAGCTINRSLNLGCCELDPGTSQCTLKGEISPGVTLKSTDSCDLGNATCNITIEIAIPDAPPNVTQVQIPICTNRSSSCLDEDCYSQVCGSFKYNPTPSMSYKDIENFKSNPAAAGQASDIKQNETLNLYGATCAVVSNKDLNNVMQNTKGSVVNTFRFGIGDSFGEFDRYRWLFPISDGLCNSNPLGEKGVDRYENYLLSPAEFAKKKSGASFEHPDEKVLEAGFCPKDTSASFQSPIFGGPKSPNYKMLNVTYSRQKITIPEGDSEGATGDDATGSSRVDLGEEKFSGSTVELDKEFYLNFLNLIYDKDIKDAIKVGAAAPFECESPAQCKSGNCNFVDYGRGICKTTAGGWVECACFPMTRTCRAQRYTENQEWLKVKSESGYKDLIKKYLEGENFITVDEIPIEVINWKWNPDCTSGKVAGNIIGYTVGGLGPLGALAGFALGKLLEEAWMDPDEDRSFEEATGRITNDTTGIFPTEIQFFDKPNDITDTKKGIMKRYVGYSFLTKDAFLQTDFARACGIKSGDEGKIFDMYTYHPGLPSGDEDDDRRMPTLASLGIPVPEYIGVITNEQAECHWDGDDEGSGRSALNILALKYPADGKTIGNCLYDEEKNFIVSRGFGWCEACSYATLAKQKIITLDEGYMPSTMKTNRYVNGTEGKWETSGNCNVVDGGGKQTCQASGQCSRNRDCCEGYYCSNRGDNPSYSCTRSPGHTSSTYLSCPAADNPSTRYDTGFFDSAPDPIFLQKKQQQYLMEGVMPIFDLTDDSNWPDGKGKDEKPSDITDAVINKGPSVLIVGNINKSDEDIGTGTLDIESRLKVADEQCPRCLLAVRVLNGAPNTRGGTKRLKDDLDTLATISPGIMERIDLVAYAFYPSEYTKEDGSICSTPQVMSSNITANLEKLGNATLVNYKKLSLITEFSIDDSESACWGKGIVDGVTIDRATGFLSSLFIKQRAFAKDGIMGIVYSDVSELQDGPGSQGATKYTDQFCSLEQGSRNMVSDAPIMIYTKIYAAKEVTCMPCTEFDVATGKCRKTCENRLDCVEPEGATPEEAALGFKCPDMSIPDPCTPCSEMPGTLDCIRVYNDGTSEEVKYYIAQLNDFTPDAIASLPYGQKCCLKDENGNYTYDKQTSAGASTAPMIFTYTGDTEQDCGIPDYSSLTPSASCSQTFAIPLKNYKMECVVSG